MQKKDLTGKTFSLLRVEKEVEPLNGKKRYLCVCNCGNKIEKSYSNLVANKNNNQSCGCMTQEWQRIAKTTHGGKYTRLYNIWQGLKARSVNSGVFQDRKEHNEYKIKNIKMCIEWLDYAIFEKWAMENGYSNLKKLSIDRKENDKGYFPENCRWTNSSIQSQNTKVIRKTNKTGYRGVSKTTRKKNPYRAIIYLNKKQINLGSYSTAEMAALAYDKYVIENNLEHNHNNLYNDSHAQKEIRNISDAMQRLARAN